MNRDNQPLSSHLDKGWLAGIIDGEGCLQLARQRYRNQIHFRPQIVIGNTNPSIIDNIVKIAKANDLPVYVMTREKPAFRSKRKSWVMQIMGLKRCQKWIEYIGDELVGKKQQAEIMKDYIDYRLSQPPAHSKFNTFGEKDFQFKERITKANQLYKGELLND